MTHPFILERAKVLAVADYKRSANEKGSLLDTESRWTWLYAEQQEHYIAMAQAITDHDTKEGRKVVERAADDEMADAGWAQGQIDDGPSHVWTAMHDAAPAYPGEK